MHNDYRLLQGNFQDRQEFPEAFHLYIVGRPLQALLINWQGWIINSIRDLAVARFVSFLFLLSLMFMMDYFLRRRLKVENFWSKTIVLSIMTLPVMQISVIWVANFLPSFLTLVVAFGAYLVLDKSRGVLSFVLAGLLFMAALLIYPPNALFVFVGTFCVLLFSPADNWKRTLKTVLRDVAFFGANMVVYYVLVVRFFMRHAPPGEGGVNRVAGTTHEFHTTFNVFTKLGLIKETFIVSLGGVWHSFLEQQGAIINMVLIVLSLMAFLFLKKSGRPQRQAVIHGLGALGVGLVLFLLTNAPALMAKGCFQVLGYRVLASASIILLIAQLGLWAKMARVLKNDRAVFILKAAAIGFVAVSSLLAFVNMKDASANFKRELNYIRTKVASTDWPKDTSRIFLFTVAPFSGETLVGRKMPYELSYMITHPGMAYPIVNGVLKEKGRKPIGLDVNEAPVVLIDNYTTVMNINEARVNYKKEEDYVTKTIIGYVTTSSSESRRVEMEQEAAIFMSFYEPQKDGRLRFWRADTAVPGGAWFQVEFKDNPRPLVRFACAFYTIDREGNPFPQTMGLSKEGSLPLGFHLKGSTDGKTWTDLPAFVILRHPENPNVCVYQILNPGYYTRYRFYLAGSNLPKHLPIGRIYFAPVIGE